MILGKGTLAHTFTLAVLVCKIVNKDPTTFVVFIKKIFYDEIPNANSENFINTPGVGSEKTPENHSFCKKIYMFFKFRRNFHS